jgi:hypothetical protein
MQPQQHKINTTATTTDAKTTATAPPAAPAARAIELDVGGLGEAVGVGVGTSTVVVPSIDVMVRNAVLVRISSSVNSSLKDLSSLNSCGIFCCRIHCTV